jgi:signal transduction histidine kinase
VPKPVVKGNRERRRRLLEAIERKLQGAGRAQPYFDSVRRYFAQAGEAYDAYFAAPSPEAAKAAKDKAGLLEGRALGEVKSWFRQLQLSADRTTLRLERAEEQARLAGIVLGALAAFVGLLVTMWAVLTLRPLSRLRDGVRKVARGEYRERVTVAGGVEVAEVAREFNAMAAAIEEREQELVRSERLAAVGKMAAVITHEVRNPLSSIGLNAELLEEELGKLPGGRSEAANLCRAIHKEVDRLTAITEEYLRFARLPRPRLVEEQVNVIVSQLVDFQKEELAMAGVQVSARLADGLPPVAADEAQLRQALLNLVRNAAESMTGGGGTLVVETRRGDGGAAVEIVIADTGPGIPAEHLGRIFEPFFTTKERGTGLGLALTQQIVAEHGGRIDVESIVGRGTRFVVRLPSGAA